jgi:hypothetical protein
MAVWSVWVINHVNINQVDRKLIVEHLQDGRVRVVESHYF